MKTIPYQSIIQRTKGGILLGLKDSINVSGVVGQVIMNLALSTGKGASRSVIRSTQIPSSMVKGGLLGIIEAGAAFTRSSKGVANGAVLGAMKCGVPQKEAVVGAVQQAVLSAYELNQEVDDVAIVSIQGAVAGVKNADGDAVEALKCGIQTAHRTAAKLSEEIFKSVERALLETFPVAWNYI